jgi:purine-nucleoside phosphorylase
LDGFVPQIALILGTGLGALGDQVEDPICIPYPQIPHFPRSTVQGHRGQLVFGTLEGKRVAVMQGRMHYYEGNSMQAVCYPLRVLHLLGAQTLVVTNAAGCINTDWRSGDLMLIRDQIKLTLDSPLRGENLPQFGPRFPDSTQLYTPRLCRLAQAVAAQQHITLREGVYMFFPGPQYETPAEIRAARILGADAAGMSTAPEVIAAHHCGMEVLGFSLLSNMAAGITDAALDEQEVLQAGVAAQAHFGALVRGCLAALSI